jgi:hypothetical protein
VSHAGVHNLWTGSPGQHPVGSTNDPEGAVWFLPGASSTLYSQMASTTFGPTKMDLPAGKYSYFGADLRAIHLGAFVWISGRARGRCQRCEVRSGRWSRSSRSGSRCLAIASGSGCIARRWCAACRSRGRRPAPASPDAPSQPVGPLVRPGPLVRDPAACW